MSPKISVFITSYNQKDYLKEAIESVIDQTLMPFEIIIVDDCSTDGSQNIIKQYADKYPDLIRPFCHKRNLGIAKNKAFAQKQAKGDWLTYLDGDDRFLPDKLKLEWKALQKDKEAKIAYSNFYFINEKGERTGLWADKSMQPSGYIFSDVFSRDFPHSTVFRNEMISSDSLKAIGFYDESLECYEDWDLKIRLSSRYTVVYSGKASVCYRLHENNYHKKNSKKAAKAFLDVYRKNMRLLETKTNTEKALVKCRIESIIALSCSTFLNSKDKLYYSPLNVSERCNTLLDKLSESELTIVSKETKELLSNVASQAAFDSVEMDKKMLLIKNRYEYKKIHFSTINNIKLAKHIFPTKWICQLIKKIKRFFE